MTYISYVSNDIELQLDKYLAQIDRPTRQSLLKYSSRISSIGIRLDEALKSEVTGGSRQWLQNTI